MTVQILRADARQLPLPDASVDLVVTSPPYFALRSYQDGGEHYDGQIGSEPTPAEFLDALIAVTAECVRVLKPSGSMFVNLGDKYSQPGKGERTRHGLGSAVAQHDDRAHRNLTAVGQEYGAPAKSLIGIPWRYALRCIDDLGLILRAEIIWSKPNGLPESVTDRVRRSHEQWFHFTVSPRYYSAVDEIRETASYDRHSLTRHARTDNRAAAENRYSRDVPIGQRERQMADTSNPLGKLPGSVWTVPTQPLTVPAHLGVDHFAAFPTEWPKRLISGWCPAEVCTVCGEGRRPVAERGSMNRHNNGKHGPTGLAPDNNHGKGASTLDIIPDWRITGYACACPDTSAPATPGVVLDPFGGTGTTALVAHALGRHGISVDLSADYCRLATWRTSDRGELARVLGVAKPPVQIEGQADLFDLEGTA